MPALLLQNYSVPVKEVRCYLPQPLGLLWPSSPHAQPSFPILVVSKFPSLCPLLRLLGCTWFLPNRLSQDGFPSAHLLLDQLSPEPLDPELKAPGLDYELRIFRNPDGFVCMLGWG